MSIVRWVLVAAAALVAAGSLVSYAGVRFGGSKSAAGEHLYYCPMHPSVVQDHPGECPICSMTLVPRPVGKSGPATAPSSEPGAALADIELSPERIQLIGMRTAVVRREELGGELRTVGVVTPDERGLAQINTRFSGWVEKLFVSETGERVSRGQILATIYSPEVLKAQQELLVARGWSGQAAEGQGHGQQAPDLAGTLDQSARRRLELLGISGREIDQVVKTGKLVEAIAIRSPVAGYVVEKNAVAGGAVQPGTELFRIADLSTVWVNAEVYEFDAPRVRVGQPARLELAAYPGETHSGKVKFINPVLDARSRTLRVRLEFKNRIEGGGPRLRPGMYGTVYLALPPTTGLMVPAEAVVDTGERHYLFVARKGGHFQPRTVRVGARAQGKVEILSGVAEGETVVTTGNFLVDSESRLRSAIEGQAQTTTPPAP
jgi:Cu(I)/Ag(I) efflux system membrane fusion protein